jgi:flagellar capping protein FliD
VAFVAAFAANPGRIADFLGSATTGGFLKSATASLDAVEHLDTGFIKVAATSLQRQISNMDKQIDVQQERVDLLQANLQRQMAAADALIASMQQQYTFLSGMFQAFQNQQQ